jgi:hypothetical protein
MLLCLQETSTVLAPAHFNLTRMALAWYTAMTQQCMRL